MREEYDFSKGVRGKYADRVGDVAKLVALDPDVARKFPTAEAVNEALRSVVREKEQAEHPSDAG